MTGHRPVTQHAAMRQEGGSAGPKAPPAPPQASSPFPSASHTVTSPRGAGISPLGHRTGSGSLPLAPAPGGGQGSEKGRPSLAAVWKPAFSARGSTEEHFLHCTQSQIPQPPSPALFLETHVQCVPRYMTAANEHARRHSLRSRGRSNLRAWSALRAWWPRGTRRTLKQQTKQA